MTLIDHLLSPAGRALSDALKRTSDWACDKFVITHVPSGLAFWHCNGGWFFDGYPDDGTPKCLGLIERHWLYFKARPITRQFRRDEQHERAQVAAKLRGADR